MLSLIIVNRCWPVTCVAMLRVVPGAVLSRLSHTRHSQCSDSHSSLGEGSPAPSPPEPGRSHNTPIPASIMPCSPWFFSRNINCLEKFQYPDGYNMWNRIIQLAINRHSWDIDWVTDVFWEARSGVETHWGRVCVGNFHWSLSGERDRAPSRGGKWRVRVETERQRKASLVSRHLAASSEPGLVKYHEPGMTADRCDEARLSGLWTLGEDEVIYTSTSLYANDG